ncbi:hypothetical protein QUH12_27210, partial [Klebsiella pneumoniae]|nr:hypothetical protein [Klebsiella pneumoniae]
TEWQEQESARGSHQGETPGIFIVLSGFATTDLSVKFCDACQGSEPMEKRPLCCLLPLRAVCSMSLCARCDRSPQPNGRSVATE